MLDAYIYCGRRSAFGRYAGVLSHVRPDDLLAKVLSSMLHDSPFDITAIEDVIIGCANQAGEDSRNVARHAALVAGIPCTSAAVTVNRLCGSGLAAIADAARSIALGEGAMFVAGGVESMSRAPFVFGKSVAPFSRQLNVFDSTMGARFPNPIVEERFGADTMPETADNIARELSIKRSDSDFFALRSQQKYAQAKSAGLFDEEILPLVVHDGRGNEVTVAADEHPRSDSTIEKLDRLRPLNPEGIVTAGSASGVNDGAAALVLGNIDLAEQTGAKPQARIVSIAVAGVEPRLMGLGPVPACRKALDRAGLSINDMDIIEINEAFSPQVLGCLRQLKIDFSDERINPNGGAIAIGHPLGASGARLALTATRQLERTGGRYALVSMCIGIGQGIAVILERSTL